MSIRIFHFVKKKKTSYPIFGLHLFCTNSHRLPKITRGYQSCYQRLPEVTTGYHRLPQDTTGYHRLPKVTTGYHRLAQVSTGYHRLFKKTQFLFIHICPVFTQLSAWLSARLSARLSALLSARLSAQLSTRFLMFPNLTNHYIKLSDGDLQCE